MTTWREATLLVMLVVLFYSVLLFNLFAGFTSLVHRHLNSRWTKIGGAIGNFILFLVGLLILPVVPAEFSWGSIIGGLVTAIVYGIAAVKDKEVRYER